MKEKEKAVNWMEMESRQIAVCKTDKALLELVDSLKPSGDRFPATYMQQGKRKKTGNAP